MQMPPNLGGHAMQFSKNSATRFLDTVFDTVFEALCFRSIGRFRIFRKGLQTCFCSTSSIVSTLGDGGQDRARAGAGTGVSGCGGSSGGVEAHGCGAGGEAGGGAASGADGGGADGEAASGAAGGAAGGAGGMPSRSSRLLRRRNSRRNSFISSSNVAWRSAFAMDGEVDEMPSERIVYVECVESDEGLRGLRWRHWWMSGKDQETKASDFWILCRCYHVVTWTCIYQAVGWMDKVFMRIACGLVNIIRMMELQCLRQLGYLASSAGYALALALSINHQNIRSSIVTNILNKTIIKKYIKKKK